MAEFVFILIYLEIVLDSVFIKYNLTHWYAEPAHLVKKCIVNILYQLLIMISVLSLSCNNKEK